MKTTREMLVDMFNREDFPEKPGQVIRPYDVVITRRWTLAEMNAQWPLIAGPLPIVTEDIPFMDTLDLGPTITLETIDIEVEGFE